MKYFTEREFSGIFSLAGEGNFASSKSEFPVALLLISRKMSRFLVQS